MTYYVGFDLSHKERAKIDENYSDLRDYLSSNDLVCYNYQEAQITQTTLKSYDIFVLGCPDFAKISNREMSEIENWVKEDGGGLLLLSHAGGDRGRNSNLSELSERFGILFESDQVLDDKNNIGMENLPVMTVFNPPHPITEGITSLCYRAGCSLTVIGQAISIASSNETSDPFSCSLICVSEQGNGRICAIGSYELFRNRIGGGFPQDNHPQLALNIFKWLVSDYRAELRSDSSAPAPVAPASTRSSLESGTQFASISSDSNVNSFLEIDPSIKISDKSDFVTLFKTLVEQIDIFKGTLDNVVKRVSFLESGIMELQKQQSYQAPASYSPSSYQDSQYSQPTSPSSYQPPANYPPSSYQDSRYSQPTSPSSYQPPANYPPSSYQESQYSPPSVPNSYQSSYTTENQDFKDLGEPKLAPLSALPPKPGSGDNSSPPASGIETNDFEIGLPPIEDPSQIRFEKSMDVPSQTKKKSKETKPKTKTKTQPKPKTEPKPINKEELLAEKTSLESKLNSIQNLMEFIEKKYKNKKMDKKSYEKQIKRAKNDLNKASKRLEEINQLLEQ